MTPELSTLLPPTSHYWLRNAHIPAALLVCSQLDRSQHPNRSQHLNHSQMWAGERKTADGLLQVDLEIMDGTIAQIIPSAPLSADSVPSLDLKGGIVFPCFVDLHTHLDKGHIWDRNPNPDGTFASALTTVQQDAEAHWTADDLYRRMEFGLKCSYAHGTQAVRTHLDAVGDFFDHSLEVFTALQSAWRDRLILQPVCLVTLDTYLTPAGEQLADRMAELGGILGGVAYANPEVEAQIERTVAIAKDRHLDLDLHADETDDPDSECLRQIAQTLIRQQYPGQAVCGHCCSLAVQPRDRAHDTIRLVQQAQIGIVSLPLCNLFLQDRQPHATPRWRGVTLLHELNHAGVPVALSSDNCRDPFYGYGDHDVLEVFAWSTKIAHLDRPYGDWCATVTKTPADLMRLPSVGRIGVGLPADLVVFKARRYSELFSRNQRDRRVIRAGRAIDTTLPDYADLDT